MSSSRVAYIDVIYVIVNCRIIVERPRILASFTNKICL